MRYMSAMLVLAAVACADAPRISEPLTTHRRATRDCGDITEIYNDCGDQGSTPVGLFVPGMTGNHCLNPVGGNDADQDNVADDCEDAMAAAFAPVMRVSSSDGDYNPAVGRLGGEYYYAVTRVGGGGESRIRILYMPAYYFDAGSVVGGFQFHNGDSEFFTLDVAPMDASSERWVLRQVFLSAHCGELNDTSCGWYSASAWDNAGSYAGGTPYGAPIIWVSQDKHANYINYQACATLSWGVDTCFSNDISVVFPVTAGFNVGSYSNHYVDEVGPRRPSSAPAMFHVEGTTEFFWSAPHRFFGWLPMVGDGATPYASILGQMGFMPGWPNQPDCSDPTLVFCPPG